MGHEAVVGPLRGPDSHPDGLQNHRQGQVLGPLQEDDALLIHSCK